MVKNIQKRSSKLAVVACVVLIKKLKFVDNALLYFMELLMKVFKWPIVLEVKAADNTQK